MTAATTVLGGSVSLSTARPLPNDPAVIFVSIRVTPAPASRIRPMVSLGPRCRHPVGSTEPGRQVHHVDFLTVSREPGDHERMFASAESSARWLGRVPERSVDEGAVMLLRRRGRLGSPPA